MTSSPRLTEPVASESTLPCSRVMKVAISFLLRSTRSRNANRILVRAASEVSRQPADALVAAATAASTTGGSANATSAVCSPLAGSKTGPFRSAPPAQGLPSIQCVICLIGVLLESWGGRP